MLSRAPQGYGLAVEMRDWALSILEAKCLDDKLRAPSLTDHAPGLPLRLPLPARPPGMGFSAPRERARLSPGLESAEARGALLHRLANHELLALEVMAATVLAFPDAAPAFRADLARTMAEEQQHLRLYLSRMEAMGVELGQFPMNDFIWRAAQGMATPLDYTARVALVFEQANLDYARHYRGRFAELGDTETAGVLSRVYADEVGHVRDGLRWFRVWTPPGAPEWDTLAGLLAPPLSLARARGPHFDHQGRRAAGFSTEFVERLSVHGASRGRPPSVYWFNAACEDEVARGPHTPTAAVRALAEDLAPLCAFLAAREDVVVTPRPPSPAWCAHLGAAGYVLPEFVPDQRSLRGRKLGALEPWGWTPAAEATAAPLRPLLVRAGRCWSAEQRSAHSKVEQLRWKNEILDVIQDPCISRPAGEVATSSAEAHAALGRGWVVKAPFSTAGRGRIRGPLTRAAATWVQRQLAAHGELRVEPWRERVLDLSFHYDLHEGGVAFRGTVCFETDTRGCFTGTVPGQWIDGLEPSLRRWVGGEGRDRDWLRSLARAVGGALAPRLWSRGVRGAVGVDAMVYRDADTFKIDPVVEVNCRYTMGRVSLSIQRRLHPSARARWRVFPVEHGRPAPRPLAIVDGLVRSGTLFTTDPSTARAVFSVMEVV